MIARIAWMLARPSAGGASASVLPIVAFGIVTALLLGVLSGAQAFWSWTDSDAGFYQILAVIALALLVVPLVTLGGSAARLAARRRDDRLATLRLLGATPRTVAAITVLESTALAIVGGLIGVAVYTGLVPFIGLLRFRGEALAVSPLWLSVPAVAAVVCGIGVLAAVSAVVGLRRVIISPLGVRTRQAAPGSHWIRLALGAAVIVVAFVAMNLLQVAGGLMIAIAMMGAAFGGTLAVLNVIGPAVIQRLAKKQARTAKTPARLLAARGILESPKAAWRQVSGVAMTSFLAVFAGTGLALANVASADNTAADSIMLVDDVRTGVLITVAISFLVVACSAGVNQAAGVLDRRDLYVSLDRLGMPRRTMDASRSRAVMSPLRIVTVGSAIAAAVVVFPLTGMALLFNPLALVVIAGCLAAGMLVVWLGLRATRPVLLGVLASPERV